MLITLKQARGLEVKANRLKQDEMGEAGIPTLETVLTKQNQRLKCARINAN